MTTKVFYWVAAVALGVTLTSCGAPQVTIHGNYAIACASSLTFYDGQGNQLGVARIRLDATTPFEPGSCSVSGSYSVTVDEADTYKVEAHFLDPEGGRYVVNDVMTLSELRVAHVQWNIVALCSSLDIDLMPYSFIARR